ncbi:hypothetical protein BDV12DRAFT_203092 [Aspergillus spectabilis]
MTYAYPMRGPPTSTISPVITTALLTVSPVSSSITVQEETIGVTGVADDFYSLATINVTTEIFVLPNRTDLPVSSLAYFGQDAHAFNQEYPGSVSSITTNYYFPVIVSNLPECTLTEYTYTEVASLMLSGSLVAAATDQGQDLALYVTTYDHSYSTNLGGQVYTTTWCDVYLNSKAVRSADQSLTLGTSWRSECVDPRSYTCDGEEGENVAATGSGGCKGYYPPTEVVATATESASETGEGGGNAPEETGTGRMISSIPGSDLACLFVVISAFTYLM